MTRNKSKNSWNSTGSRGKGYNNRVSHGSEDDMIERQSSGYAGYNPRKKYTGSEDETAGLWYDFD